MIVFDARYGPEEFTIGSGADGSSVDPVDFGRPISAFLVVCEDCSNIAGSSSLTAQVVYDDGSTMVDLYEINDPTTKWSQTDLPTSGTLGFYLEHAGGAQQLRLVLGNNASGGSVVFKIYGFGAAN